jgi:hypothetical protein
MTEQRTPEQWQEAVDLTHACLAVNAGRLVEGFTVTVAQVAQCETTLAEGKALGYEPNPAVIDEVKQSLAWSAELLLVNAPWYAAARAATAAEAGPAAG